MINTRCLTVIGSSGWEEGPSGGKGWVRAEKDGVVRWRDSMPRNETGDPTHPCWMWTSQREERRQRPMGGGRRPVSVTLSWLGPQWGFSTEALWHFGIKNDIGMESYFEGCFVHCRMFVSISGLYLLDVSIRPPPRPWWWQPKIFPDVAKCSMGRRGKITSSRTNDQKKGQNWRGYNALPHQSFSWCGLEQWQYVTNVISWAPSWNLDQFLWG